MSKVQSHNRKRTLDFRLWTLDLPRALEAIVFYALLVVIALAAIPYGTVQPWWKSVFRCLVFAIAFLYLVAQLLGSETPRLKSAFSSRLLRPILALIAFAFLQTLSTPSPPRFLLAATDQRTTISADVYQTRQFVVQLLALLLVGWLLVALVNSRRRLRHLVELVIGIGVASALFGLWRQVSQHGPGFFLPGLRAGFGYAQFINTNHFAFLMELALGLTLGIVVCRGVKGRRLAIYLVAAVPMWIALVLSNSRGGILSLLCQVLFLALLFSAGRDSSETEGELAREPKQHSEQGPGKLARRLLGASRTVVARGVLVAALLAGAVTTVVLVGGDPLAGRVERLGVELDRNIADSYTLRPAIWRATWGLIKDHPIAGVGFGGYWIAITKYHAASGETTPQQAHNDYLELFASGGVIGLALGIWFAVALFKTVRAKLGQLRDEAQAAKGKGERGKGQGETVVDDSSAWHNSFARAATIGALVGILTVAVHSLVDFGLHITINAVVFTVLVAIVANGVANRGRGEEGNGERRMWDGE